MKRRTVSGIAVLFALAACQPSGNTTQMVGQLESDRIELAAEFSEPIVIRHVTEGQHVREGDPIIQLNTDRAAARFREIEASLARNKARHDELIRGPRTEQIVAEQANVDGAILDVKFRVTELRRAQSLLDRELASPTLRDRGKAALDAAEAKLEFHRARLSELLTGTTIEELDQARAEVQRVQAQLDRQTVDLRRHTTLAPVDGVIDSLLLEAGERPMPGQPMAIMLAGQQPYARVYVPESQRVAVEPGTKAVVFVDGRAEPIDGTVRWVASESAFTPYFALTEHDRGRLTYAAKIDLNVQGRRLPDGVPLQVELRSSAGK